MTRPKVVRWQPSTSEPPLQGLVRAILLRRRLRIPLTRFVLARPLGSRLRRLLLDLPARVAFAHFNRGDIRLSVTFHAADAAIHTPLAGLDIEMLRGSAGAARTWELWAAMWEFSNREVHEIVDAGDRLLLLCTHINVGRDGLELRQPVALMFTWRDGEIVEHREFRDHDEALRIVGASAG